jgi:ubiquinol-cytochrome c reductase cytochrome b subunit
MTATASPQPGSSSIPERLWRWFDERSGVSALWPVLFARKIPIGVGYLYTLGFATMFLFIIQATTGMFLAMYYSPSPDHAYDSIQFLMYQVPFGAVVRGIHHWGASGMVVAIGLHMAAVFTLGAYKYPRELTWMVGVILLALTIGLGFTGYLLPWDEKAYWATVVGTSIPGTVPLVGDYALRIIRGGSQLGVLTLSRFYSVHTMLLPASLAGLLAVHLFLIFYHGVSVPPGLWERGPRRARGLLGTSEAVRHGLDLRGSEYHRRYDEFKERGHFFWPNIIVEDLIVAAVVMIAVFAAMVVMGVPLEAPADPTNTTYVPRPDWYFLFLFQMLKVFPGFLEWFGAVVVPTVILLAIFFLPLYDRSPWRSPTRRPVAMAVGVVLVLVLLVLTYIGAQ